MHTDAAAAHLTDSSDTLNHEDWIDLNFFSLVEAVPCLTARIRGLGRPIGQVLAGLRPYREEDSTRWEDPSSQVRRTNTFRRSTRLRGRLKSNEGEEGGGGRLV